MQVHLVLPVNNIKDYNICISELIEQSDGKGRRDCVREISINGRYKKFTCTSFYRTQKTLFQ